jgi:ubiquitin carboxyl-terminal hydrolase 14
MVRFAWRADINKKTKIMVNDFCFCFQHGPTFPLPFHSLLTALFCVQRKVRFPLELDALDLATDELKAKILPVSHRLKEIEKERAERRKVRRKMKVAVDVPTAKKGDASGDVEMSDSRAASAVSPSGTATDPTSATTAGAGAEGGAKVEGLADGEIAEESVYHTKEVAELAALVHADVVDDVGCSVSGLYELVGESACCVHTFRSLLNIFVPRFYFIAIVTHKGAAADGGHYIGFVKKSVFHGAKPVAGSEPGGSSTAGGSSATAAVEAVDDEDWYKFDDEKVSVFPAEKLGTLDGGGEYFVSLYHSGPRAYVFCFTQGRTRLLMCCYTRPSL